ncbi:uncharacterized protein [Aristolochia californica]|uniref:uncharacterized protein n=1 Tax=Aristolochia californica TaxID=171875 RepID=UPI0035DD04CF
MKISVTDYVAACQTCQWKKAKSLSPIGLLQPLQLSSQVWLHGMPASITSDRDSIFTSTFWKELFKLQGTKLAFSSAYHPQTDGQTEVVNRMIEVYLRCFVGDSPKNWVKWQAWAEFSYNTSYHSALGTTLFKVVYDRDPPRLLSYEPGTSKVATLDQALAERDAMLNEATFIDRLQTSQTLPKILWTLLDHIGTVVYHLQLPSEARIHNVFHVSQLQTFQGDSPLLHTPLPLLHEGRVLSTLAQVLQTHRMQSDWEVLMLWTDADPSDTTWETLATFRALYPSFELEDKLFLQEGVMLWTP